MKKRWRQNQQDAADEMSLKEKKIPSIKKEKQKQMQNQKQSKPIISKRRGRNKHKQKENKT